MIKWSLVVILCGAGVMWFVVTGAATAMASRATTRSENLVPFLGLFPVALGVAIAIWG